MTSSAQLPKDTGQKLKRLIEKELLIYDSYLEVLIRQRETVPQFNLELFEKNNKKLLHYSEQLEKAHNDRQKLLKSIPGGEGQRLSDFVEQHFVGREQSELMAMVKELRSKVETSQNESKEFQMISNFALNLVNGSISLLWQATQNVTRCYSPKGDVTESFAPTKNRDETTLKKV